MHDRKVSGSAFTTDHVVLENAFTLVTGVPKIVLRTGISGMNSRLHSCPNCNITLFEMAELWPGRVIIKAGTLDDKEVMDAVKPEMELFISRKAAWLPKLADNQFETQPLEL